MDIYDFIRIFTKRWATIVIIVLIFWGLSVGFLLWQGQGYEAGLTFTVNPAETIDQKDVDYYLYDNYFALQAAGALADTIASSLASPATVAEIYQKAGLKLPQKSLRKLSKTFEAKKNTALVNVISATTKGPNKEEVEKLVIAAREIISNKTETQNTVSSESNKFIVNATDPVVLKIKPNYLIYSIVGIIIGLIFGILALSFQEGLKRKR